MAFFNQEWINQVPRIPARFFESEEFLVGSRRLEERNQGHLLSVFYWTLRLGHNAESIERVIQGTHGVSQISAGFIPELGGRFGLVIDTDRPKIYGAIRDTDESQENRQGSILVDDREFPFIVRDTSTQTHCYWGRSVISPKRARTSCWVRSSVGSYAGWLLPRHALMGLNRKVKFSDGGVGYALRHFGGCLDAAVVSTTVPPTNSFGSMPAFWPIVQGQVLRVVDDLWGYADISVMGLGLSFGILKDLMFPVRFSTDWIGRPGLSGAMIFDPTSGAPAGMYLGALYPAGSEVVGYAQTCYQLQEIDGMEFYL